MNNRLKTLITGSNGFIGEYIVSELSDNVDVYGCGRNQFSKSDVLEYFCWDISSDDVPYELKWGNKK